MKTTFGIKKQCDKYSDMYNKKQKERIMLSFAKKLHFIFHRESLIINI